MSKPPKTHAAYKPGWVKTHGGKRAGAGRKKATPAAPDRGAAIAPPEPPASLPDEPENAVTLARSYSAIAVKILANIAVKGAREAARVSAASKIIEIAKLGDSPELDIAPLGKKEQRAVLAAEENVGRLATPSAPRLIINNR
jgi:hypothetical protein